MSGPKDFDAIATAILKQTSDNIVIISMLVGAGLESGWDINKSGGGAFQITVGRPSSTFGLAYITGGGQIDADVEFMLPRYQAAALAHTKEPESADKYANIAHDAERPALPYQQSQGESKIAAVYQTVVQNYGNAGATGQAQVDTVVGGNIGAGFLGPVLSFLGQLGDVRLWRSLGWVGLGILVFVLGLVLWLRKATPIGKVI